MSDFSFNFISSPASASSPTGWVYEESHTADFGDKRLNERFERILEEFSDRPNAAIPAST
ncbi:MAG: transposase, partial [Planctomycetaceae bacterium]|nr:transposase [Planctomycetaceae bacterium]